MICSVNRINSSKPLKVIPYCTYHANNIVILLKFDCIAKFLGQTGGDGSNILHLKGAERGVVEVCNMEL